MSYSLGVDLGTTFVAAAVARDDQVRMVALGDRSVVMPSVVYMRSDGALLAGEPAGRRMGSNPGSVASGFKRRLGDPTPVLVGGAAYSVTELLATLLRDVLDRVAAEEGGPPERLILTHPANWGPYQRELFAEVARSAGADTWWTVTEPEAAAAHYAATRPMAVGDVVAVYDLGGGTFDATVLGRTEHGIEVLGIPQGIERLGGADLDEAIVSYVNHAIGGALTALDMGDPSTVVALARLRQDCVLAKETLSLDTEATIPVSLPGRHLEVDLDRGQLESIIRGLVESTVGALSRAVRSASITPDRLSSVLLVGGSSQIPLVQRMIAEQLGCPTVADAEPKHAVALGAAALARSAEDASSDTSGLPVTLHRAAASSDPLRLPQPASEPTAVVGSSASEPAAVTGSTAAEPPGPRPAAPGESEDAPGPARSGRRRRGVAVVTGLLLLAGAGTGLGVSLWDDPPPGSHPRAAGAAASAGTPASAAAHTAPVVVLPTDPAHLVGVVTADPSLAGAQSRPLIAQLEAVQTGVGEARRQAALSALHLAGGAGVRGELASAVISAVSRYTLLDTPADMIADLKPDPALGGPNARFVLGCMQQFLGRTPQQQQEESREILAALPRWSANGAVRPDLVEATVRIVTPVAQGQQTFDAAEAAGGTAPASSGG